MGNIFICPGCGRISVTGNEAAKCPGCSALTVDSGIDVEKWQTMSASEKETARKKVTGKTDGIFKETFSHQSSTSPSSSQPVFYQRAEDRSSRAEALRECAKFVMIVGIIGAIGLGLGIGILVGNARESAFWGYFIGALIALIAGGTSVLIPLAMMVLANMAEDIGDMRDKEMRE